MMTREQEMRRNEIAFLSTEDRIPRDHLLRKIDEAVDFGRLYEYGIPVVSWVQLV